MVCGRDAAFAGVCCSATGFRGVEPLLRVVTGMLEQRWKVECQLERREFQTRSCHENKGNSIARVRQARLCRTYELAKIELDVTSMSKSLDG